MTGSALEVGAPSDARSVQRTFRQFARTRLAIGALVCLLAAVSAAIAIRAHQEREQAEQELANELELRAEELALDARLLLEEHRESIRFLSILPPISGIQRAWESDGYDRSEGSSLTQWERRLQRIFRGYMATHPDVLQLRYIGYTDGGREIVRVERAKDRIFVRAKSELQRKGDSDYMVETRTRRVEDIYVSPISLNKEHGRVQVPHQPTVRLAKRIVDAHGRDFGALVINVDLVEHLERLSRTSGGFRVILTNELGDYLAHPNSDLTFGFDRGQRRRFSDDYRSAPSSEERPLRRYENASGEIWGTSRVVPLEPGTDRALQVFVLGAEGRVARRVVETSAEIFVVGLVVTVGLFWLLFLYWRRNQEQLWAHVERSRLGQIVAYANDAIIGVDLSGRVESWNRAARRLFGYSEDEALGALLKELGFPEQSNASIPPNAAIGSTEEGVVCTRKDGSTIDVRITTSGVFDSQDNLCGASKIVRDVSEEKAHQERIERLNDSLESKIQERTAELLSAREDALAASEAKSQFLANMSHEIRTPMNAVQGMLQLLRRTPLSEVQRDYAQKAQAAAKTLLEVLNDILDFSKIESGKLELSPVPFRLDRLLRDLGVMVASTLGSKNVDVLYDIEPDAPKAIVGDSLRLQQVLLNLLSNAVKFTERGEIVVSVRAEPSSGGEAELSFSVRDTGLGMTKEQLHKVFEGFVQAEASTTRRFGGTGLGLAISRRLVQLMGGSLRVESELGRGSTFSFSVRVKLAPDSINETPAPHLEQLCVAVLDKNAKARDLLSKICESLGWRVRAFSEVSTWLVALDESEQFDVVLLDHRLMGASTEAVEQYRTSCPSGVVFLMNQSVHDLDSSCSVSVDQHIIKPITGSTLFDAVVQARTSSSSIRVSEQIEPKKARLVNVRILLVEDLAVNRQIARELLTSEGAIVSDACGGLEALSLLRENPLSYHVVLMDVQMPDINGLDTARRIRNELKLETLPIIAMTANAMESDKQACHAAGMNDHIGKPFHLDDLVHCIRRHSKRSQDSSASREANDANQASLPPSLPSDFDFAAGVARMGGNQKLFCQEAREFCRDLDQKPDELRGLLQRSEREHLVLRLHSLKGLAGTFGALSLAECATKLEEMASTGSSDEELEHELLELEALIRAGRERLAEYASRLVGEGCSLQPGQPHVSGFRPPVSSDLVELMELLSARNMAAVDVCQQLDDTLRSRSPRLARDLAQAMTDLRFDEAVRICNDLQQELSA